MKRLLVYSLLILMVLISVLPFLWVWSSAMRSSAALARDPLGLPWPPSLDNFVTAWTTARLGDYAINSIVITLGTVFLVLLCSTLAAYALASLGLWGSNTAFLVFLVGLMIPTWALIIPLFHTIRDLGLLNTHIGVILVQSALGLPFGIFLLRAFFRGVSHEIFEAARVDGAGHLQVLWHIVVPVAMPALQALFVFQFMFSWNELLLPLFLLQRDEMRTIPLGLTFFQGRYTSDQALIAAGTTLASLPVLVVYLIFNRHFIRGMTAGALKG